MPGHHLVIAGTGRAGTTALVQLLEACGLETNSENLKYIANARAGLEIQPNQLLTAPAGQAAPYVVKHPYLSDELGTLIEQGFDPARIDGIIVPLRDLDDAATSRIQVFVETGKGNADGGLWRAMRPGAQKTALATSIHALLLTASEHQIPVHFIMFPRFITDPEYAWHCLRPVLPDVTAERFVEQHRATMRPDFVHRQTRIGRRRMAALDLKWWVWRVRMEARRTVYRIVKKRRPAPSPKLGGAVAAPADQSSRSGSAATMRS